ncbi:hypothetical protein F4604DRAFT_1680778 [Suillus subluteus]|nr:hypothetical protein F4604DRAFT_1680778 [Suillus subluteus]
MTTQTNQSTQSTECVIIGCLFAFTEPNGLIEVPLIDSTNGEFTLTRASRYFRDVNDIERYHIKITSEEFDEPSIIHVLYDKKLHGTPKCPYLVIRVTDEGQTGDLKRKDYMAATKAIKQKRRTIEQYGYREERK